VFDRLCPIANVPLLNLNAYIEKIHTTSLSDFFCPKNTLKKNKRKTKINWKKKTKKNNNPTFLKHCYLELVAERKLKQ